MPRKKGTTPELSAKVSAYMQRLWQDPDYRTKMVQKQINSGWRKYRDHNG